METSKRIVKFFLLTLFVLSIIIYSISLEQTSAAEVYPFNGIINADALVVHSIPDTSVASSVTELVYGTRISVIGEEKNMYKITYDSGLIGYVSKSYVMNIGTMMTTNNIAGIETYSAYCSSLKNQGFHESYCPYLYYLHGKYPNWVFKPDIINYTISEIAKNEEGKVSLQTSNSNYFIFLGNGEPHINEYSSSGNYYFINESAISSFIDPRNSLFENTIFQFMNLEKSTNIINDDALKKIASGYLANYYNEFKNAANVMGVNALHLLARSSQEGANRTNPVYSGVRGTFTTDNPSLTSSQGYSLDGYYNFFNINSYVGKNEYYTSSIQRGLSYAAGFMADDRCMSVDENGKGYYEEGKTYEVGTGDSKSVVTCGKLDFNRPWNTPEKAILGGSEFIGGTYVKKGQNSLFFQKFNIASYSANSITTHQYMTNAYAPQSEGLMLRNAYIAGKLLNSAFEFVIPVYKNMTNEVAQAVNKSSNNKLTAIKINGVMITGFDSNVTEYNYNLTTGDTTFTVVATAMDSKAKVAGVGKMTFSNGSYKVNIEVTAENGSKATYVVNVKQIVPASSDIKAIDIVSKMAVKVNDVYMYGISPGMQVTALVSTATKNGGNAVVTDINGKSKTTGNLCTGDRITVKGTKDSLTYTIAVRGDISGDGLIKINDLILLQSHILDKNKLSNEKYYAADVNYDSNLKINDLILIQSHILEKASL